MFPPHRRLDPVRRDPQPPCAVGIFGPLLVSGSRHSFGRSRVPGRFPVPGRRRCGRLLLAPCRLSQPQVTGPWQRSVRFHSLSVRSFRSRRPLGVFRLPVSAPELVDVYRPSEAVGLPRVDDRVVGGFLAAFVASTRPNRARSGRPRVRMPRLLGDAAPFARAVVRACPRWPLLSSPRQVDHSCSGCGRVQAARCKQPRLRRLCPPW